MTPEVYVCFWKTFLPKHFSQGILTVSYSNLLTHLPNEIIDIIYNNGSEESEISCLSNLKNFSVLNLKLILSYFHLKSVFLSFF